MDRKKDLREMSLEELWQLFPISLTTHQPQWKGWAEEEMRFVADVLAAFLPVITHIGSTAIPNIAAKPIIDLLVEINHKDKFAEIKSLLESNGYICMSESNTRMSFNKGYTPDGFAEKVYHLHLRECGDNDEIYFRDYLREHPEVACEYAHLKQSLLPKFRHNRDGYTDAKSEFVKRITELAKMSSK